MHLFSLSLLLGLVSVSASAAPTTYTINFSGGSPTPSGSFTYDSSTQTFTNFLITWNSIVFNFTTLANADPNLYLYGACNVANGLDPADLFAALNGSPSCGSRSWSSFRNSGSPVHDEFMFFGEPLVIDYFALSVHITPPSSPRAPLAFASGSFSISPTQQVPEPSCLLLMSTGGVLLALRRRRAPGSLSNQAKR